ncbi:MAG: hypothetical protein U9Q15_04160 [Patescibacteria group bacterium]|nr:hypothetical protein [Patescibacteria group bacterium]
MVGEARKQQIKNSAAVNYVKNKFRKKEDFKEENLSDKQKEQIQKGGHAIDQVTGQAIHKVFDSFQKAIDKENFGKLDSKLKSKFEKTFDAKTGEDIYALKKGIELTAEEQGKVGDMQDIARYKFHKNEYMGSKMVRAGQGMLDSLSKEEFDSALQTGDLIQKKKETAPGETAKINSNELDFGSKEATKIKYNALDHYMKTEK